MLETSKRKFAEKIISGKKIIINVEMSLTPSFYQGRTLPPNFLERIKSNFGLYLLIFIIIASVYIFMNWQKSSRLLGFNPYRNVAIGELLSYANFYDGKRICTKGYYVETQIYSVIKISLYEDEFTRSAWVNAGDHRIFPNKSFDKQAVVATICGYFESRRDGLFGAYPFWIHQITVASFKTEGDPFPVAMTERP